MGWVLAVKAFFKAFTDPENAEKFIKGNLEPVKVSEGSDLSHLHLLTILQQSGRLIDFFKEDIKTFNDAQIGAAVRKIHENCSQELEKIVTIRAIREEEEGARITIPVGYDPASLRVIGQVKGEPPYMGILVHKGWEAHQRSLPKRVGKQSNTIICPAEVEVK